MRIRPASSSGDLLHPSRRSAAARSRRRPRPERPGRRLAAVAADPGCARDLAAPRSKSGGSARHGGRRGRDRCRCRRGPGLGHDLDRQHRRVRRPGSRGCSAVRAQRYGRWAAQRHIRPRLRLDRPVGGARQRVACPSRLRGRRADARAIPRRDRVAFARWVRGAAAAVDGHAAG